MYYCDKDSLKITDIKSGKEQTLLEGVQVRNYYIDGNDVYYGVDASDKDKDELYKATALLLDSVKMDGSEQYLERYKTYIALYMEDLRNIYHYNGKNGETEEVNLSKGIYYTPQKLITKNPVLGNFEDLLRTDGQDD